MIKISLLKISWIWTETFRELLEPAPKLRSKWGEPGLESDYAPAFAQARTGSKNLRFPWRGARRDPDYRTHRFWTYYLENRDTDALPPGRALKDLVPLFERDLCQIRADWLPGTIWVNGVHFPHGIGLVVSALIRAEMPLAAMVDMAIKINHSGLFEVSWPGGPAENLKLVQMAQKTLDRLRSATFGAEAHRGDRSTLPFNIATILRGSGIDSVEAPPNDGEIHRALEALCTWNPNWKVAKLPLLAQRRIPIRSIAPDCDVLYGTTHGRAVWFPSSFQFSEAKDVHEKKSSLGCFHGNLESCSLQTEILTRLLVHATSILQAGGDMSASMARLVKRAAGLTGRLYGGSKSVYSSFSPSRQIDDNGWTQPVTYVRQYFGTETGPLAAKRP